MSMQVTTTVNGWHQNCKTTLSSWQDQGYELEARQNTINEKYQNYLDAGFSEDYAARQLQEEKSQLDKDYDNWVAAKSEIVNSTFETKLPDIDSANFWDDDRKYSYNDLEGEIKLYNEVIKNLPEEIKKAAEICFINGNYQVFMLMAVSCVNADKILDNLEHLDDKSIYNTFKLYYDVYNKNDDNKKKYNYEEFIDKDGKLYGDVGNTLQQLTEEVQKQSKLEAIGLESEKGPLTLDKFIEHLYGDTSSLDTETKKRIFETCYLLYEKFDTDENEVLSADELMEFYDGIDATDFEKDGVYSFANMNSFMEAEANNQITYYKYNGKMDEYIEELNEAYKEWNN